MRRQCLSIPCIILSLIIFSSELLIAVPQNWAKVYVTFQNRNRYSWGEHTQECPPCWHSCPFGNWGVSSNFGDKIDGDQFKGWFGGEWNSCTQGTWEAPNCSYYNANGCTEQANSSTYGYSSTVICVPLPALHTDEGCSYLNGRNLTFSGSFMTVYELDPADDDEFIKTLYYPNVQITYSGCTFSDCPLQSSTWTNVSSYQPSSGGQVINAQIQFQVTSCEPLEVCP
jgi:hypothetical protein